MNHEDFDDELLSAYVDGELTAAERARVEERLRTDPAAAQLVEELRALSTAIKALPRQSPGRDLRQHIDAALDEAAADGKSRQVIPLSEPLDPPRGFRRGFFWSTIAIAAALLLMFTEAADEEAQRDLAAAKREPERVIEGSREKSALRKELPAMGEMRAAPAPPGAEAPAVADLDAATAGAPGAVSPPADAPEQEIKLGIALTDEAKLAAAPAAAPAATAPVELPASAEASAAVDASRPKSSTLPTIELAVAAADAAESFDRLLRENGVATQPATAEIAALAKQRSFELHGEAGGAQYGFDNRRSLFLRKDQAAETQGAERSESVASRENSEGGEQAAGVASRDAGEVGKAADKLSDGGQRIEVLVEGSPEQIEQIVAACRSRPEIFRQIVKHDFEERVDQGDRTAGDRRVGGAAGVGGGTAAEPSGAVGESLGLAGGRAWFLPSTSPISGDAKKGDPAKALAYQPRSEVEPDIVSGFKANSAAAPSSTAEEPRPQAKAKAKEPAPVEAESSESAPIEAGHVRVLFVLEAAPPAESTGGQSDEGEPPAKAADVK